MTIRDCSFIDGDLYYSSVENFLVENSVMSGLYGGISVYTGSSGLIEDCSIECNLYGIVVGSSTCEIRQTRITGGNRGIYVEGNQSSVTASLMVIETTVQAAVQLFGPSAFTIHDSDLLPASGFAAEIYEYSTPPARHYDFTGNYWGATDTTAIEALIRDAHDSAVIDDYVDFVPFAGSSTPTAATTWGAVKTLFR